MRSAGWSGSPCTWIARPSSTVTSIAQVSGQSCGQAARTSVGAHLETMAQRLHGSRGPRVNWVFKRSHAMQVIESILADAAQITALRRDIHAHPELCFKEKRTSDLIAEQLTAWGIPIHRGLGTTGIVAILKNGTSDRAVGLRADIDALPITENNSFAHKSLFTGKMHACGHDGHTAMLLAAAKHLSKHKQLRRHRLPHLPAGRRRRRRRARDDQGRPVREVPDGGGVRRPQLARHEGRPVRAEERPGVRVEQRVQDHRSAARARTRRCRTTASTRCRSPARSSTPSRPSSAATSGRSTPA